MKRLVAILALSSALLAGGAADASARTVWLGGHVLAPPASAGPSVSVPVLLTGQAERRLRAGTPFVRLLVRRRAHVSAPRALGAGRVRITPGSIRPGDRFAVRLRIRPKLLRRARHQRVPSVRVRALRVTARASALSNDELTRLVLQLQAELAALSRRMDQLAATQASDIGALRAELATLTARVTALESGLAVLQGSLSGLADTLGARIDALDDQVGDMATRLTAVESDVTGLVGQVGILQTAAAGLQSGIAGLQTQMGDVEGDVGALDSAVSGTADNVTRPRSRTSPACCPTSGRCRPAWTRWTRT